MTRPRPTRFFHASTAPSAVITALLLAAPGGLGGCNILGPAMYFVHGPEKTDAAYKLNAEQPVVVFVDDSGSLVPDRTSRRRIGQTAEKAILEQTDVTRVISSDAALAVVSREKFGKPLGVSEVGEAVGAEVVIYALINGFSLSPDGVTYQPIASALVRVVDVKTKERIWPVGDETARQVMVQSPERQGAAPASLGQRAEAERRLAAQLGEAIGKLFYKHESSPSQSRVGGSSSEAPG